LNDLNEHLEEYLLVFLLAAMSLLIGVQVFMRYVMQNSLAWSEELARYCFIWATYIGIAYGVRQDAHIRITAGMSWVSKRNQPWVNIVAHVLFLVFALIVVKEGYFMMMKIFGFGQRSSSLGILMGYVYLAPLTGFLLVIFRLLQRIRFEFGRAGGEGAP
jgi:TRAP-type C4-dicarboxylate transport system permease small subunit